MPDVTTITEETEKTIIVEEEKLQIRLNEEEAEELMALIGSLGDSALTAGSLYDEIKDFLDLENGLERNKWLVDSEEELLLSHHITEAENPFPML